MREIRFRAWDTKEKKMWNKNNIVVGDGIFLYGGHDTSTLVHSYVLRNDLIPMQFTGLKDKNGNEIYEGDIVTTGNHGKNAKRSLRVVKWLDFGFNLKKRNAAQGDFEIIGNIWEDGYLLKV